MKNNQADIEGTVSVATMAFDGDVTNVGIVKSLATSCAGVTDADRCEAAEKIMDCGRSAAKSQGLSFDDL